MSFLGDVGGGAQLGGQFMQLVGAYYQASAQKGQLRGAAMSAEFDATMASLNARAAEREANAILLAGQQQAAIVSARYGQARSEFVARTGARGIRQTGSAAEVRASIQAAKEMDLNALRGTTVQAANAAEGRGVDLRNRALLSTTSARNLRTTAGTINPWGEVLGGLIGSSGSLAQSWRYREKQ